MTIKEFSLDTTPNPDFEGVLDISPATVFEFQKDLCLIDVRQQQELQGEYGHIEGSSHILLDELPGRLDEIPNDRPVVFICRSGMRSARASALAEQNFKGKTYNMMGGMMAWCSLGYPSKEKNQK